VLGYAIKEEGETMEKAVGNGKAENLAILATIDGINVPPFVVLRPAMSERERSEIIRDFLSTLSNGNTVAVRSSVAQEDSSNASFAGMYATKLRVPATVTDVQAAVDEISASWADKKREIISHYAVRLGVELADTDASIIVQEMIEADMSGVIFSHSLTESDGYYMVSISSGTGAIVSGTSSGKLIRVARGLEVNSVKETWLRTVLNAMRVVERHFRSANLDVEFAFLGSALYILQCRPITTVQTSVGMKQERGLLKRIESLNALIVSRFHRDVLGDMIDINPLELLGVSPAPLDISIFKYLFADRIVERVRREMGYDPLHIGLLRVVAGKPYSSMRATAFSFRPCGIPDRIYNCMVEVYRGALIENPALQSRVEFDLYAMSVGEKLEQVMAGAQLEESEKETVRYAFARIDSVFREVSESYPTVFEAAACEYEKQTSSLGDAPLKTILEHVAVGTGMFVRVARLAFYWKNKFEELYPEEDLNGLIAGHIHSVNGRLQADLVACRNGVISREDLVRKYGHLRPGQFSVFGECYEDDPESYLFSLMERAEEAESVGRTHAFEGTAEFGNVIAFMQAREQIKFLFSQSLHLFATNLKRQLAERGISKRDASRMSWEELNAYMSGSPGPKTECGEDYSSILLPDVIIPGVSDLRIVTFAEASPSYITNSVIKARVCAIERVGVKANFKDALVLLPNADPGYDFLFHSGAVGIITKAGGPASHMCIRAIELKMPACIGCGESMYQALTSAPNAILDCSSRQIIVLD
jgi:hypothetical protein